MGTNIIAGVATGGIPHGVLAAEELGVPFIYVRSKVKEHGKQNQIEGVFEEGQSVVLIEDLISSGKSSIEAAETLHDDYQFISHMDGMTMDKEKSMEMFFHY